MCDAALATLEAHALHDIAAACDRAVEPKEWAALLESLRELIRDLAERGELDSPEPVTHVWFGTTEHDNGRCYDEHGA
ncbi:hypothetical protein [Streptomyces mirabilis]|uniref:hypothetical protein n=1 Tax=Streptomyces mirabilis TaxID=68239 RepID=UPI0036874462